MKKNNKNKKQILLIFIVLLVCLLALGQLVVSHYLATMGEQLSLLEARANQLERENQILEEEIKAIGSLSKISLRAKELGFVKTTAVLHLTSQLPVALK
jgi:flagellar basal body-associated protein FliL